MIELSLYSLFHSLSNKIMRKKKTFYIGYNRWLFKHRGYSFGENMQICNHIYVIGKGTISIGNNFTFSSGDGINPLCKNMKGSIKLVDGKINIGDNVGISSGCLWSQHEITIGNHVNIGGNCLIIDNDAHPVDFHLRRLTNADETISTKPIVIEDDVWIGANSIVLKGVTIGARSIIGAGSVVTKRIPPDCIAAGNPCRVIKKLRNEI